MTNCTTCKYSTQQDFCRNKRAEFYGKCVYVYECKYFVSKRVRGDLENV